MTFARGFWRRPGGDEQYLLLAKRRARLMDLTGDNRLVAADFSELKRGIPSCKECRSLLFVRFPESIQEVGDTCLAFCDALVSVGGFQPVPRAEVYW